MRGEYVDTHFHLSWAARTKVDLDLSRCKDPSCVYEEVRKCAKNGGTYGNWIVGTLLHFKVAKEITLEELDEASMNLPTSIATRDGHMAVANSKALKLAGVDCSIPDVECLDGKPTGRVYESAMQLLRKVMPDPSPSTLLKAFKEVMDELYDYGFIRIHTMSSRWLEYEIIKKIRHPLEVWPYMRPESFVKEAKGVKLFIDGVFIHGTAMTEGKGRLYTKPEVLKKWLIKAREESFKVAVHVMGDEALDLVLDVYESVDAPGTLRVEHAALVRDDQLGRLAKLRVPVTVQPGIMEGAGVEELKKIIGNRWREFMRVMDFIDYGIPVYAGSDHPVGPWKLEDVCKYYQLLWRPVPCEIVKELYRRGKEL